MVEGAVRLVYQRIYFTIRNMIFFSLEDLNKQLWIELEKYNDYLMVTYQASRRKLFIDLEEQYLQILPAEYYQIKYYKRAKIQKMGYILRPGIVYILNSCSKEHIEKNTCQKHE